MDAFVPNVPTPRRIVSSAGEDTQSKGIPRVDTFASNLHDSWGAHAQHDSPPANESTFEEPPRLSTDSLPSATSVASKASSGESPLSAFLAHRPHVALYPHSVSLGICKQSSHFMP